mgnify:CR=1 FL=1
MGRGFSVAEIRNLVECSEDLVSADAPEIEAILAFHKVKSVKKNTANFNTHTSSSAVQKLVENLKAKAVNN